MCEQGKASNRKFLQNGTGRTLRLFAFFWIAMGTTSTRQTDIMAVVQRSRVSTSTICEIWTPPRAVPSPIKDDATLSTSNQRSRDSFEILRRTTTLYRHAFKSEMTDPKQNPIDPNRSKADPSQMVRAGETVFFSFEISDSEKKLSCLIKGPRTKCWTQARAPATPLWAIGTPLRQTETFSGKFTGPLTTSAVRWKIWKHKHQNTKAGMCLHWKDNT